VLSQENGTVSALGHDWGEWVVTKPATETEEGQETRTCARCDETGTRTIPARIVYSYVGPDGQAWTKGGTEALTFTFKRSFADELTFGLFVGVEVDGKAVSEKDDSGKPNYTVESGSLILQLQPSFLESLAEGDHTVTARFQDGSASATFTVKAASRKDEKKEDQEEDQKEDQQEEANSEGTGGKAAGTGNTAGKGNSGAGTSSTGGTGGSTSGTQSTSTRTSTPKTGDTTSVIAGAAMAVLVTLALAAFALARKKLEH
jgi:LPXTG-motif cell wall-anchored protein